MSLEAKLPFRETLRRLSVLILALPLSFAGCRSGEKPGADTLSWDGAPLSASREISSPTLEGLKQDGFPGSIDPMPLRSRQFDDAKLELLEFRNDIAAYAAFQSFVDPAELSDGFALREGRAFFRKGKWLGLWKSDSAENGKAFLQSKLNLPSTEDWSALPKVYDSFLQQGRIPNTERILLKRFLGMTAVKPVFSAQFVCHDDSASVYAAPEMPVSFSRDLSQKPGYLLSTGRNGENTIRVDSGPMPPLELVFTPKGMVGVEGCFDTALTQGWLENQKRALNGLKSAE